MEQHLKYRDKKITLKYCNYKNLNWYVTQKYGYIILFINANYSPELKSKILHKVIAVNS